MFLGDLIQRTLGETAAIAPRRASRFEPGADTFEPVTVEMPAPRTVERPAASEMPLTALNGERTVERIETRVVERPIPTETRVPEAVRFITPDKADVPTVPAAAGAPMVEMERPAARRDSVRTAPSQAAPEQVVYPVTHEVSRETVIRELQETRVESRTIERRLEALVKQPQVERIERIHTQTAPEVPREAAAARTAPMARRGAVIPEARQAPRSKAAPIEITAAEPAGTVQVTIGRVEIRATQAPAARQTQRGTPPKLGLDDYLQRRERA